MNAVVSVAYAFDRDAFLSAARTHFETAFGGLGADAESFILQVWGDALAEDMATLSLDDLVKLAEEFWDHARARGADKMLVRVRSGEGADGRDLGRDVLEIVGRDRPFLVDSVMGEIASHGLDVLAMFHPVVQVRRDEEGARIENGGRCIPESMIQVHLDALTPELRDALEAGVRQTLADVRDAVEDWNDMRAQMDEAIEHVSKANTPCAREELDEAISFLKWLRDNHFAFLGCRVYYFAVDEDGTHREALPTGHDLHLVRRSNTVSFSLRAGTDAPRLRLALISVGDEQVIVPFDGLGETVDVVDDGPLVIRFYQ